MSFTLHQNAELMGNNEIQHEFHPTILRDYDIRGTVGVNLCEKDAFALGLSFGMILTEAGYSKIAVGYDGRLTSVRLEKALCRGLRAVGIDILRVGLCSSPMLYFAVYYHNVHGGIMVTGSHNAKDDNGFKMMLGNDIFFGSDIKKLGNISQNGDVFFPDKIGKTEDVDVLDDYIARLLEDVDLSKIEILNPTVIWDAGSGASGEAVAALTKKLPGQHILLNCKIDGNFPVHHPDPTEPENLLQIQDVIKEIGADIGFAFDGDGDRIVPVDHHGRAVAGDYLLAILAEEILEENPGATIVGDVKSSQYLFDRVTSLGGKPMMSRVGHSYIKNKIKETSALLGGEMSSHIFYNDRFYGFDDALYAALRLLNFLAAKERKFASFIEAIPQIHNSPEIRFFCPAGRKFEIVPEIYQRLKISGLEGFEVNDLDGIRVSSSKGWWLLRASNTQEVLTARIEAEDAQEFNTLKKILEDQLLLSGITLPDSIA
jgi:phosphomannomutase